MYKINRRRGKGEGKVKKSFYRKFPEKLHQEIYNSKLNA